MKLRYGISAFALVFGSALVAPSCGGTSTNSPQVECEAGVTRECVGFNACRGGQICMQTGNWSGCACDNPPSGLGGEAGRSVGQTGGAGPSLGGGTSGELNGPGSGGAAGSSGITPPGPGPGDDPCPPDAQLLLDCSGQCRPTDKCTLNGCPQLLVARMPVKGETLYVRTPKAPGANRCACVPAQQSYVFNVGDGEDVANPRLVFARVESPWVSALTPVSDLCSAEPAPRPDCHAGIGGFLILTSDPDAPARNVKITRRVPEEACE
jgi:hypothetical protein